MTQRRVASDTLFRQVSPLQSLHCRCCFLLEGPPDVPAKSETARNIAKQPGGFKNWVQHPAI